MNQASKTVYFFSFYLFLTGLTLIFAPNLLLGILGFEQTTEIWIKVIGVLALAIGGYYNRMAPSNNDLFNLTSVYVRMGVTACFTLFVLIGWAKLPLLGFGAVDLLGALWTWNALKKQK